MRPNQNFFFKVQDACTYKHLFFAAQKIHVSTKTKEVLDEFGSFNLEYRGLVDMKVTYPTGLLNLRA